MSGKKFWVVNIKTGEKLRPKNDDNTRQFFVVKDNGKLAVVTIGDCVSIQELNYPYKVRYQKGWIACRKAELDRMLGHVDDDF